MAKYRLKKEYVRKVSIVQSEGRGYRIDSDFLNRYPNAETLIAGRKEIGHFFTHEDGKPVNDAPKPVGKKSAPKKSKGKAKSEEKAEDQKSTK